MPWWLIFFIAGGLIFLVGRDIILILWRWVRILFAPIAILLAVAFAWRLIGGIQADWIPIFLVIGVAVLAVVVPVHHAGWNLHVEDVERNAIKKAHDDADRARRGLW